MHQTLWIIVFSFLKTFTYFGVDSLKPIGAKSIKNQSKLSWHTYVCSEKIVKDLIKPNKSVRGKWKESFTLEVVLE